MVYNFYLICTVNDMNTYQKGFSGQITDRVFLTEAKT